MFTTAIVRPPGANFADALTSVNLGAPDYLRALHQHALYCAALERCGLTLTRLEADEQYPDSTFVEDTAVLLQAHHHSLGSASCAILTRPGAVTRAGEVASIAKVLARFFPKMHAIEPPGTVDGGDICEAENHFFIGISARTNEAGAQQLEELLALYNRTSSFVDIRRMNDILHLKSGVSYLGDGRLAVIDALSEHQDFQDYDLIHLDEGEEYAANCVRVNRRILVAAGYPRFEQSLREVGYETVAVEMNEFQKMDGGLSCLSLRF